MSIETSTIGIFGGRDPLEYSPSSPYTIFLFQAVFIIVLCQILHYFFKKLQQPKVIAEVVAGILLGPTVMGKIPNFTNTCFNAATIPNLTLFANLGIILFLFIVGLEVDLKFIRRNLCVALSVGLINMAIPFALGCGIAKGLYNEYHSDENLKDIGFPTFMVFIAVAMCITAFPVLARILTELNLIGDRVGSVVLAAGITNDLTGWILLALVVTLANSSSPVSTVYIFLTTLGWFTFLCIPVRISLNYYLKRYTIDLVKGEPSQSLMSLIIVLVFISAFFTDVTGVHPIFGAFMVGIVIPRDNGYVISIVDKIEDIVHLVFVPTYFALAGLSVNLGLLNRGIDWAYIIGIISLAMIGKVGGGFIAAKFNGLLMRESLAVGVLMSCKGIVEIVVLNVGLTAGIISQRIYSMFIVMALVTTFVTTPLTVWVYPISYRQKVHRFLKGEIDWEGNLINQEELNLNPLQSNEEFKSEFSIREVSDYRISKIFALLRNIDTMFPLMAFTKKFIIGRRIRELRVIRLTEFNSRASYLLDTSTKIYDDIRAEADQTNLSNSISILSIEKAISDILRTGFSSILIPSNNCSLAMNGIISKLSKLLVPSIRAQNFVLKIDNDDSNSDFSLLRRFLSECKSHIVLFVIDEELNQTFETHISYDSDMNSIINSSENLASKAFLDLECLNLFLKYDNVINSSDCLSIFLIASIPSNLIEVDVFLKASKNGFEEDFEI